MMDSKGQRYGAGKDANMNKLNEIHMDNLKKEARSLDKNRTHHFQLNPNHGTAFSVTISLLAAEEAAAVGPV